ncbi:divergent polysaccharide deacetylase family protein [Arhodomonas aquaeolei]|uniref:divergent polysaccharide deacetylase family protein n=1 Tax=Arhodomonas aquaeolei TaxID=2369 RepID=UPI002167DB6E|nr:divergent polysaccharide deacetylase family protein [Arhodomonas aquaeolei]MCS4505393.1 divergent polysaccharide deacetylase family protein [Arhodomonas aquaeolei]
MVPVRAVLACLVLFAAPAWATPRVAIIIDDLGQRPGDVAVAALPGAVSCSVLPERPYSQRVARAAHEAGKEVLLHQPMEAMGATRPVPGAITLDMLEGRVRSLLEHNLAAVPYVSGVNNHQGSLITRHPGHMTWVLDELHAHGGLYFIDSRTTAATVAERMAREQGVPVTRRDVFLDNVRERDAIRARLDELVALARRQGHAVAIGHPYPETIAVLRKALPALADAGVELVPASALTRPGPPGEATGPLHAAASR